MSKLSPKKPDDLKTAFAPDAWERFESLMKSAAKTAHVSHEEAVFEQRKEFRSGPLSRKTPLKRKGPLRRQPR
jgi:hypothetical protein